MLGAQRLTAGFGGLLLAIASPTLADSGPQVLSVSPPPALGVADQNGLQEIALQMSESVTIAPGSIRAWGVVGGELPVQTAWNETSLTLTLSFSSPVQGDRVTVVLGAGVTNATGASLDGEIANPIHALFPSGDGVAGGIATFRINVLQGDANRDGITNAADLPVLLAALGSCGVEADDDDSYNPEADLNADGCVNVLDVQILLSGLGSALPPLDGTAPGIASIGRDPGMPLSEDLAELGVTFSETIVEYGVVPGCIRIRSADGTTTTPVSTALQEDQRTIACVFDPPLTACGDYKLLVASSFFDPSGEAFMPPDAPLGFQGSAPPPAPLVNAFPRVTAAAGVTLTGSVPLQPGFARAAEVRVQGIDQVTMAAVAADGTFSVTAPLKANNVNVLYVTAISPCGISGAPITAEVSRDNAPPSIAIAFPLDGTSVFANTITVGGFVGDTLSGFDGLQVQVNGIQAVVDIGIGQNGTWVAPSVPLLRGGRPTVVQVVATDGVGNSASQSITVVGEARPMNVSVIETLSGDAQGGVARQLLGQPIRVMVTKADGTPWANKIVDFRVIQNDGHLSGDGVQVDAVHFQTLTDASGVAAAQWTLGSASGCGVNRVSATAKDVAGAATFSATAAPGVPVQMNVGTGNDQRVEVGAPAAQPLSAWVSDSNNPVPGVPVQFTVVAGGGTVNGQNAVTVLTGPTGHAEVAFIAGPSAGENRVRADFAGNTANAAYFKATGIARDLTKPTSFSGLVLDNASQPIGNVKISLKFQDEIVGPVLSDATGNFTFPSLAKDGAVHLIVEGVTANKLNGKPLPPGVKFPSLGYDISIVPNAKNSLGKPILLPQLMPENSQLWDGQSDIELTCAGIEGLKYVVRAHSMTLKNGSKPSVGAPVTLSINQVHHAAVPMPLPNGASPPFDATFQPAGATFDPPVEVEYPNMSGLAPGALVYLMSFNHDTGEFEVMAPGVVSEDGAIIRSVAGTGLRHSGWHGPGFPFRRTGRCVHPGDCPESPPDDDASPFGFLLVESRCPALFDYFIVRKNFRSSPMHVRIYTTEANATVSWIVTTPNGGQIQTPTGTTKEFDIKPIISAASRPLTGAHEPSPPVTYWIDVTVTNPNGTTGTFSRTLKQNPKTTLRQEYVDFRDFEISPMPVPQPLQVGAPIETESFSALAFNTGNYGLGAGNVVSKGHMFKIAQQTYDKYLSPMSIESAFRNPRRNFDVDGASPISNHMYGSAVDMHPMPESGPERMRLYRAAILASSLYGGTATKAILEKGGAAVLPINWMPPPPVADFAGEYLGTPFTLVCDDPNGDDMVDRVASISDPGIPTGVATFDYVGSPLGPVTYYAKDDDGDGFISPGDRLRLILPAEIDAHVDPAVPRSLLAIAFWATHVHAGRHGYLQVPASANDGGEGEVVEQEEVPDDQGQPTTTWTYSVGGETVTTGPSGAFELDNISAVDMDGPDGQPDGVGDEPVQVIGNAMVDGVMTYAMSERFYITQDAVFTPAQLVHTTMPPPLPVSLTMSAPILVEVGNAVQATVMAHMNDGTILNVSDATAWTAYRSSNQSLATVDGNGLVTGHAPGTVFITATNGAATAVSRITVMSETFETTITGSVRLQDGTPVEGAVLVTPVGGRGVSAADGTFAFDVVAGETTRSLTVTAVATIRGTTYSGLSLVTDLVPAGLTDAGVITLTPGATCDLAWLPAFGERPGISGGGHPHLLGIVNAVAVFDDGDGPQLFIGGDFGSAGSQSAIRIARWNGESWAQVGSGLNGTVQCLTVYDDGTGPALYAGGYFMADAAGETSLALVARWSGGIWTPLGEGIAGSHVDALAVFDDGAGPKLVAGGVFSEAGGASALSIASWDGTTWSPLTVGIWANIHGGPGWVRSLASFDDGTGSSLFVGGSFLYAGGGQSTNIAKWDGRTWHVLPGLNGSVAALAVVAVGGSRPSLFAGGEFIHPVSGPQLNYLARWDGASWNSVGGGTDAPVYAITAFNDGGPSGTQLHVGGDFESAGGVAAASVARWNGTSWSEPGDRLWRPGYLCGVRALAALDVPGEGTRLVAGGCYPLAGKFQANGIAISDGATWRPLGRGFSGTVDTMLVVDDPRLGGPALWIGGDIRGLDDLPLGFLARWNGRSWDSPGGGMDGRVSSLALYDDGLGGGPRIVAGGSFTTAGGVAAANIASWDGSAWSPLGSGLGPYNSVNALAAYKDGLHNGGKDGLSLYAGGTFVLFDGNDISVSIARWDGRTWHGVDGGIAACFKEGDPLSCTNSPNVRSMVVFDDGSGWGESLYVAGTMYSAGPVHTTGIARWDGSTWSDVGGGLGIFATSLAIFDAGTGFGARIMAGTPLGLHEWDGVTWLTPAGQLPFGGVQTLLPSMGFPALGPQLLVGGEFWFGKGENPHSLARWNGVSWTPVATLPIGSGPPLALSTFVVPGESEPRLILGGGFFQSEHGDSYFAMLGCDATRDAPPQRAVVPVVTRRPERRGNAPTASTADLRLKAGDSLLVGDETRRYGSVVAEAGSTIRLTSRDSHLIVTNLTVEPGATFEWLGGTIEIDGGAWLHPYEITIGCDLDARLVLRAGAFVRAPKLLVCEMGSLVGDGAVDAFVQNGGAIAGEGSGLRLLGGYVQEPAGTIIASIAELDAVFAGRTHACSAVDALPFTTGRATHQLLDVDGDGDLDLVRTIGTAAHSVVAIWLRDGSKGDGPFGTPILCSADAAAASVTIADLNGDGVLDLELTFRDGGSECTLLSGGDVEVTR